MALGRTYAVALAGVEGHVIEVAADIENGLVALLLVGLPDTALRGAGPEVIVNSQQSWPQRRITVGLSPASPPKPPPAAQAPKILDSASERGNSAGRCQGGELCTASRHAIFSHAE